MLIDISGPLAAIKPYIGAMKGAAPLDITIRLNSVADCSTTGITWTLSSVEAHLFWTYDPHPETHAQAYEGALTIPFLCPWQSSLRRTREELAAMSIPYGSWRTILVATAIIVAATGSSRWALAQGEPQPARAQGEKIKKVCGATVRCPKVACGYAPKPGQRCQQVRGHKGLHDPVPAHTCRSWNTCKVCRASGVCGLNCPHGGEHKFSAGGGHDCGKRMKCGLCGLTNVGCKSGKCPHANHIPKDHKCRIGGMCPKHRQFVQCGKNCMPAHAEHNCIFCGAKLTGTRIGRNF
jgi:hypothetical protein